MAIFSAIAVLLSIITANGGHMPTRPDHSDASFYILTVIACVMATVTPFFEFSGFNNKRNLDTLFSLPISRRCIACVHLLTGWIQMLAVFTLSTAALVLSHLGYAEYYDLLFAVPYYFSILGLVTAIYFIVTFLFIMANNTLDGMVFAGFWVFNLWTLFCLIDNRIIRIMYPYDFLIAYAPSDSITLFYQRLAEISDRGVMFETSDKVIIAFWALAGVCALFGTIFVFERKKVEKIGEVSDSIFGYKLNIPLFLVCLAGMFNDITATVWLTVCAVIGYFVYRRSFKLKKSDVISIVAALVVICILNFLPDPWAWASGPSAEAVEYF